MISFLKKYGNKFRYAFAGLMHGLLHDLSLIHIYIGFASRAFKEDGSEDISKAMESGQYCIDAVVAVVNKENTDVTSLTQAQLKSIFTGETLKWEDIK